jgi:NADH-quinone oxidoreductase subunit J
VTDVEATLNTVIDTAAGWLQPLQTHGGALLFWILAILTIASAVAVVAARNPVHSALFLLLAFVSVAGIFFLGGAEFVGAVQILVYAGGIMVLFLFVIMLVNVKEAVARPVFSTETKFALVLGALLLAGALFGLVNAAQVFGPAADAAKLRTVPAAIVGSTPSGLVAGNSKSVGLLLFSRYLVPFELASVLLLVAMIGAIVMGKKRLESPEVDR